jgi:thiol-disulfide isomerase/thioredoxin
MASEEMASEEMASDEMDSEDMAAEDDSMAEHSDQSMDDQMADDGEAMAEGTEATAPGGDLPAWQTLPLSNARSGETFTLADFAGKTVFVEPMATWCTNCRRQLGNVKDAYAQLSGDDVVFIALSVETNIGNGDLANYANEAGFDWLFAVLSPEMLKELASEFGQTIANPPSTPHFVIRPDGTVFSFRTGIESTEQIIDQIQLAQG